MSPQGASEPDDQTPVSTNPGPTGRNELTRFSRIFQSMGNPVYRLFWLAMMGQMAAMNMQMVARSWFVYHLTESPIILGVTGIANGVPMLALSLFGGVIADQVRKKYVLLAGQTASAFIALVVGLLITFEIISWQLLLLAAVFQGCVMALMMPARQAIIPEIVGDENLTNAIALNVTGMNLNRFLAPGFAGFLIAVLGVDKVYYAMTGLYLVATAFVLMMPITGKMSLRGQGTLAEVKEGLNYIKSSPVLPGLLVLTLISVLLSMPYMMLLPMFTADVITLVPNDLKWMLSLPLAGELFTPLPNLFADSAFRLGLLMTVSGIGALVGSLMIAGMGPRRRGAVFLYSIVLTGASLLVFASSNWYFLSLLVIIPVGLGQSWRLSLSNALVQAYTSDTYRGRVMSIYMMEFGLTSFGVFGIAILSQAIGVQWAIGATAAGLLGLGILSLAFAHSIRSLD